MIRRRPKKPKEHRSTRELILDVAESHFAHKGFAGVSMREISTDAGLKNQASLYHYFNHKRALYEATLSRGLDRIVASLVENTNGREEPLDRVIDYLAEHPDLPRLIQRAGLDDNRHLGKAITRQLRSLWAEGVHVLARNTGAWEKEELPYLAAAFYHIIFGYFANATFLESVLGRSLRTAASLERQRRFVKAAMARILDEGANRDSRPPRTGTRG